MLKSSWRADAPLLSRYIPDLTTVTSTGESTDPPLCTSGCHSQLPTHSRPLFCLQGFILTAFALENEIVEEKETKSPEYPHALPKLWCLAKGCNYPSWEATMASGSP